MPSRYTAPIGDYLHQESKIPYENWYNLAVSCRTVLIFLAYLMQNKPPTKT